MHLHQDGFPEGNGEEVTREELHKLLATFMEQHGRTLAVFRAYAEKAFPEVGQLWGEVWSDPAKMDGHVRSHTFRALVLNLEKIHKLVEQSELEMAKGPGQSVRLKDGNGMKWPFRKWPTDHRGRRFPVLWEAPEPVPVPSPPPGQPCLDEPLQGGVFSSLKTKKKWEVIILWGADESGTKLDELSLAMVADVDKWHKARVLAALPLPPAAELPSRVELETGIGEEPEDWEIPEDQTGIGEEPGDWKVPGEQDRDGEEKPGESAPTA